MKDEEYSKRRNNLIAKQSENRISLKEFVSSDWVTHIADVGNAVDIIVFIENMT